MNVRSLHAGTGGADLGQGQMRRRLLGEDHPLHIRPLNDTKAIDSGANFLSESFLFGFATILSSVPAPSQDANAADSLLAQFWRRRGGVGGRKGSGEISWRIRWSSMRRNWKL